MKAVKDFTKIIIIIAIDIIGCHLICTACNIPLLVTKIIALLTSIIAGHITVLILKKKKIK